MRRAATTTLATAARAQLRLRACRSAPAPVLGPPRGEAGRRHGGRAARLARRWAPHRRDRLPGAGSASGRGGPGVCASARAGSAIDLNRARARNQPARAARRDAQAAITSREPRRPRYSDYRAGCLEFVGDLVKRIAGLLRTRRSETQPEPRGRTMKSGASATSERSPGLRAATTYPRPAAVSRPAQLRVIAAPLGPCVGSLPGAGPGRGLRPASDLPLTCL